MFTRTEYRKIMKNFRKEIGIELTKFREEKNLTREEVAKELGIPLWVIERFEEGIWVSFENIHIISRFYDKKIRLKFY